MEYYISSIVTFVRLHLRNAMTVLLLMTPCMKGLDSSGLNMPPVCLTMCQSDI